MKPNFKVGDRVEQACGCLLEIVGMEDGWYEVVDEGEDDCYLFNMERLDKEGRLYGGKI